jgi:hypothetical protein
MDALSFTSFDLLDLLDPRFDRRPDPMDPLEDNGVQ